MTYNFYSYMLLVIGCITTMCLIILFFSKICKKKFFKVKEKPLKKRTKKIVYYPIEVDVGKVFISVTFEDGYVMTTCMYGEAHQSYSSGQDEDLVHPFKNYKLEEPTAKEVFIGFSASYLAVNWIKELIYNVGYTVQDDRLNVKQVYLGKIREAKILHTVSHKIEFLEARVEPIPESETK